MELETELEDAAHDLFRFRVLCVAFTSIGAAFTVTLWGADCRMRDEPVATTASIVVVLVLSALWAFWARVVPLSTRVRELRCLVEVSGVLGS